jgi:hypothetical protein
MGGYRLWSRPVNEDSRSGRVSEGLDAINGGKIIRQKARKRLSRTSHVMRPSPGCGISGCSPAGAGRRPHVA